MSVTVCPKCKGTLQRGAWEIVTKCPSCETQWPVPPGEQERMLHKIVSRAWTYGLLSLLPVIGFLFGLLGILWGFLAATRRKVVTATITLLLSTVVGLVVQPFLAYWAYGYAMDRTCFNDITALNSSIEAYRSAKHDYPVDLAAASEVAGPVPARCRAGGGEYLYRSPATVTQPTMWPVAASQPATAPAATQPATGPAEAVAPVPALVKATQPATAPVVTTRPAERPEQQLLVIEAKAAHRHVRMVITADGQVRALPHAEFEMLLSQPWNHQFVAALVPPPPKQKTAAETSAAQTKIPVVTEDPNFRFLGMSPKQLLLAGCIAIAAFAAMVISILIHVIRREKRRGSDGPEA